MLKQFLLISLILMLPLTCLSQEEPPLSPEDACKDAGDYWSEDLLTCYAKNAMDADEYFLFTEISKLDFQKRGLLQEQLEYNVGNKATRDANYAARIASLEAKKDASVEQVVKDVYQEEIDTQANKRQFHADKDVSSHGTLISALAVKISKLREELDLIIQ